MPPTFPNTDVTPNLQWSNFSGSLGVLQVPLACSPRAGTMAEQATAVRAILRHCFDNHLRVRTMGTRWSFSTVIRPDEVLIDPWALNTMLRVGPASLTPAYKVGRGAQGFTPYFVQSGTEISAVNRRLLTDDPARRLCLQTSGAGDGHRMAGCIATATHGSALGIGALHDTILGLHILVSPDRAVFLQRAQSPALSDTFVAWLEGETGTPIQHLQDDDLFAAALVSVGSMGFLFSVVLEAVPAYTLLRRTKFLDREDPKLWRAIRDLTTDELRKDQPAHPYHFEVLFNPYPVKKKPSAMVTMMWKKSADGVPTEIAQPVAPALASDVMGFVGKLAGDVDAIAPGALTTPVLGKVIDGQIRKMFKESDGLTDFPGVIFGATNLPKGTGASMEVVVDHAVTEAAVRTIWAVLEAQAAQHRHVLGIMSLRFVPASRAYLGMNVAPMSCFIEFPSIRNQGVLDVYTAVCDGLEAAKIPFTCHWGQMHRMTPARLAAWFRGREGKWRAARARLLDADARRVFGAPILAEVGLDG